MGDTSAGIYLSTDDKNIIKKHWLRDEQKLYRESNNRKVNDETFPVDAVWRHSRVLYTYMPHSFVFDYSLL